MFSLSNKFTTHMKKHEGGFVKPNDSMFTDSRVTQFFGAAFSWRTNVPQLNCALIYRKRNIHPLFSSKPYLLNHSAKELIDFMSPRRSVDV